MAAELISVSSLLGTELGDMEGGQGAEEQQQGQWTVSWRSREGIAKGGWASCPHRVPSLSPSSSHYLPKMYFWAGMGLLSPSTLVTKLPLRKL